MKPLYGRDDKVTVLQSGIYLNAGRKDALKLRLRKVNIRHTYLWNTR
jgi:hypothetical protein